LSGPFADITGMQRGIWTATDTVGPNQLNRNDETYIDLGCRG
jgi:hypothetical protein